MSADNLLRTDREESEDRLLAAGARAATISLAFAFGGMLGVEQGDLYILTDNKYTVTRVTNRYSTNNDLKGHRIPGNLELFVEDMMKDKRCIGFVPLTKSVNETMTQKFNLEVIARGVQTDEAPWFVPVVLGRKGSSSVSLRE